MIFNLLIFNVLWLFLLFLLLNNPVLATEATPSATIVINKFQFDPPMVGMKEWVELFNKTDSEIDLGIYQLSDFDNHNKILTGKIPAKGYFLHEESSGWLNNPGDTIFLKIGESIIDEVEYKIDKGFWVDNLAISNFTNLKGKWVGRSIDGENEWMVFSDTEGPINGFINYFDGYKPIIEKIGMTIVPAVDRSGIGTTAIITKKANLINNICENFMIDIGNSLGDGKCYQFEYMATDGVGNTTIFTSNSIVKFDFTKSELAIKNAFRNIFKIKFEFWGDDVQSSIFNYQYTLSELNCGSSITPSNWSYINSNILNIGYSGDPLSILGKSINNAGLESEISCLDFVIDIVAPKIINQSNPEIGKYKIGDKLEFSLEFDEEIELIENDLAIKLNIGDAKFISKIGNILNFEYVVKFGDLSPNLEIILPLSGEIYDLAGNIADLKINNLDAGIEIDGIPPQISLIGSSYVEIAQFENYVDLGATSSDGEITINNMVNTMLGGIYEVNYSATDEAGNTNQIMRKVKVIDTTSPTLNQLSIINYELRIESNEEGFIEWRGKCDSENKNINVGDNKITIKNSGDGIYDDCQIRAWDKWGNIGEWQKIDSFEIDTNPPVINFILPTPDDSSFTQNNEIEVAINSNEKIKTCNLEKENINSWKSEVLINQDLVESFMEQKVDIKNEGILSFLWKVSSEKDWDYLKFYIDGVLIDKISGIVDWEQKEYVLTVGQHIIKFAYSKDYSGEYGEDTGWVEEIKILGQETIIPMTIDGNNAVAKLTDLNSGAIKYKVFCTDFFDNKSETIERKIIKETEKIVEEITVIPTPYFIFKTNTLTVGTTSVVIKKKPSVLGVATTNSPTITITPPPTTKLKPEIPWTEIKFWLMGMVVLGTTSGVVLLDKKVI